MYNVNCWNVHNGSLKIKIGYSAIIVVLFCYGLILQSHDYISGGLWAEAEPGHREERLSGEWTGWEGVSPGVCAETKRWSQRYLLTLLSEIL